MINGFQMRILNESQLFYLKVSIFKNNDYFCVALKESIRKSGRAG